MRKQNRQWVQFRALKLFFIFFISMLVSVDQAYSQKQCSLLLDSNVKTQSLDDSLQDLFRQNSQAQAHWKVLSSLGWKFVEVDSLANDAPYEILIGPLHKAAILNEPLIDSKKALVVKINSKYKNQRDKIIKDLLKKELVKLIEHPALKTAFLIRWGNEIKKAAETVSENVVWPEKDALGDGYEKFFVKYKNDKFPVFGEDAWRIKANKKPSEFFTDLQRIGSEARYSSGCGVTLGLLLNLGAYKMFQDPKIYDVYFSDLYINNTTFYATEKSFLQRPKKDYQGTKDLNGPWDLIGKPAYIDAVTENVKHEDYFGENVVITHTTDAAVKDLQQKSLGYFATSYVRTENDFNKYKGISREIIQWWQKFHKIYDELKGIKIYKKDIRRECIFGNYRACRAIEIMTKDHDIIGSPFFTETIMFGHPGGFKTLQEWIFELATINPDTPYSLMFYDYSLLQNSYPKYLKALMAAP